MSEGACQVEAHNTGASQEPSCGVKIKSEELLYK